jgi:hypothetical protein
VSTFQLRHINF